ncbi:divergent polysaccharide deacetylase family protein [Oleisolibacter albus]|uniref:divergent polysaccharide deacetylase family protein n=1 Tax=Oleisolibacter albus TaxID=2171757 RepID=UPI001EFE0DFB|nr:divergent polysaccharide deacetylase family protein [Oleisolibacter albus]
MTADEAATAADDGSGTDLPEEDAAGLAPPPARPSLPSGAEPVRRPDGTEAAAPPAPGARATQSALLPPPPLHPPLPPSPPAPSGMAAWRRNAVPAPAADGRPRIVIVIDDMGVDRKRSDRAVALTGPLTLSWLPYAHDLKAQATAARQRGHELIVHVPMEPAGKADPGPDAMLTRLPAEALRARLAKNLSAFDGFVGINNHMGSRFTADRAGMAIVLSELAGRGLLFLDSRTTADTRGPELAAHYRVPLAQRDVFLDHDMSPAAVQAALAKVESIARHKGLAIAIGHPHDATLAALSAWLPELAAKGFQLVPLSAVVQSHGPAS